MELRGPYDIINMATFFGLDQAKAKVRGHSLFWNATPMLY